MAEIEHSQCQGACGTELPREALGACGTNSPRMALDSLWQWTLEAPQRLPVLRKQETNWAVLLHVYDVSWITSYLGMPFFHIGVEVCETEVSFGQDGIQCFFPGDYDPPRHKQALLLGRTRMSEFQVRRLLMELQQIWQAKDYNLIGNNCQTFAVEFCQRLGVARSLIPKEYRAFAGFDWALCCRPIRPAHVLAEELPRVQDLHRPCHANDSLRLVSL